MPELTPLRDILADLNDEAADLFAELVDLSPSVERDAEDLRRQRQYGAAARVPIDPDRPDLRALDLLGGAFDPDAAPDPHDLRSDLDAARALIDRARTLLRSLRAA